VTRLVVLGATGMLGSEVTRAANHAGLKVLEVSRSTVHKFLYPTDKFSTLADELNLSEDDWLVNAIGWIPQKGSGNATADTLLATQLNRDLPREISSEVNDRQFTWIQIGTDCVFSGAKGGYTEASPKDATDLYGQSKISGEEFTNNAIDIRCSIVGPDSRTTAGLYAWYLSQDPDVPVKGFTNHLWNGVSTTVFANLVIGLIRANRRFSVSHHLVPKDSVSKFELLSHFAQYVAQRTPAIEPFHDLRTLDRRLATNSPELNSELWSLAGYKSIPSIEEICEEFISQANQRVVK
jgi:dTDP-4-dehydrorhamnose reductase